MSLRWEAIFSLHRICYADSSIDAGLLVCRRCALLLLSETYGVLLVLSSEEIEARQER
jgi:hypothetical protein